MEVECVAKYYIETKDGEALEGYGEKIIGYFPSVELAMMIANRIRRIDLQKLIIPHACLEDDFEVYIECRTGNYIHGIWRI